MAADKNLEGFCSPDFLDLRNAFSPTAALKNQPAIGPESSGSHVELLIAGAL